MRHQDHLAARRDADLLQRVEILRHEDELQNLRRGDAADRFGESRDGLPQAVDDGTALLGDTFALKALRFRFGFRVLDDEDLVRLAFGGGRDLQALLRLDLVHRRFNVVGRIDVGHERVGNFEAVDFHRNVEFAFDREAHVVLLVEHFVERHLRHLRAHDVEYIGPDLLYVVLKLVIGIRLVAFDHAELHGHEQFYEDVVERFRLDLDGQLLHAQRHALHDIIDIRNLEIKAGQRRVAVFSEAFDDRPALLLHCIETRQQPDEGDESDDDNEHEKKDGHDGSPGR